MSVDLVEGYPPQLSEDHLLWLTAQIQDWQLNHGSMLKQIQTQKIHTVSSHPIGVTLFPTPFPRAQFHRALELQSIYNELYCAVAEDEEWIFGVIRDLLPVDHLAASLWQIYQGVKKEGYTQSIHCGIFRSDYMLYHETGDPDTNITGWPDGSLKQVEFNTFSCAGASHANRVAHMHRYLTATGAYCSDNPEEKDNDSSKQIRLPDLPRNDNIESLAAGLAFAHEAYGPPHSKEARGTAILFIIQRQLTNFNIADERPLEYALWNRDSPVPSHRLDFGADVLQYTSLSDSGELLFHPPWLRSKSPLEISVVYMRAGYEENEYNDIGMKARFHLERSRAIKCPSILGHIATFKKVQRALAEPGALEHFLSPEKAAQIRDTFVEMYPMDESPSGRTARALATDSVRSRNFILKPSLEGGGNNIYGDDIPEFLDSISQREWGRYVLMERIISPHAENLLMSSAEMDSGGVISELGVFGTCLWKKGEEGRRCEVMRNSVAGWSFKTKHEFTDEMSVAKGYGCFDTPLLF